MAKQTGPIGIEGTIGNITFYRIGNQYYARQKSSLSGRRVKTSDRFENTRRSAGRLKQGAVLASQVYRQVRKRKDRSLYQRITGDAILLFKEEIEWSRAETILMKKYQQQPKKEVIVKTKAIAAKDLFVEEALEKALRNNDIKDEFAPFSPWR